MVRHDARTFDHTVLTAAIGYRRSAGMREQAGDGVSSTDANSLAADAFRDRHPPPFVANSPVTGLRCPTFPPGRSRPTLFEPGIRAHADRALTGVNGFPRVLLATSRYSLDTEQFSLTRIKVRASRSTGLAIGVTQCCMRDRVYRKRRIDRRQCHARPSSSPGPRAAWLFHRHGREPGASEEAVFSCCRQICSLLTA